MEAQTLPEQRTASEDPPPAPPRWREWLTSPFTVWIVVCAALAGISAAALPTVPSYDPWSWIVWGREVVDPHLSFAVGGGPSWKPLPFMFTTVFALFAGAAPTLWVAAARAGGLLALPAAYRLASRLVSEPGRPPWAGPVAGVLAAIGVVLTQDWAYYMFRGTSEPLLIATSLWAIDRHLAGRHGMAFALGVATSLMRPEAWPFLGLYAIWLWLRSPRPGPRAWIVAGLVAVPFFWFVPPWIGSGQPFLAASHAHQYNGHLGSDPFITVLHRGADIQVLPSLIAACAALGLAAWLLRGRGGGAQGLRRLFQQAGATERLVLGLAALAAAWWAVVVGMTLVGYPGLERFYLPATAVICVLGGAGLVGVGLAAGSAVARGAAGGPRRWWIAGVVVVGLVAASVPFTTTRIDTARAQRAIAARAVTRLDELSAVVAAVGGHDGVYPCRSSFASVNHSVQTALAWKLHVTLGRVGTAMRHQGLLFLGPHDTIDGGAPAINPRLTQRRLVARVGVWSVYRMTAPGADTRCVGR